MISLGVLFGIVFAGFGGGASIFSKRGMQDGSPVSLLLVFLVLSSVLYSVLAILTTPVMAAPLGGVALLVVSGILGEIVGRLVYFLGIEYLGPGKCLAIFSTAPLYAAVFAVVVLGEDVTVAIALGTVITVVGIVIMSGDVRGQTSADNSPWYVVLLPVSGALLGSILVTFRKVALNMGVPAVEAAAINMLSATVVLVLGVAVLGSRATVLPAGHEWNHGLYSRDFIVAGGLMTVAFLFYFLGLANANASVFFPISQTRSLFAIGISATLFDLEIITWRTIVATVVIVFGAILIVTG